jgi:transcriptional regulator with XRE-family HTH domain
MTAARFREILLSIGWSHTILAEKSGWDTRTIRRWANGQNEVDPDAAAGLERVAAAVAAMPRKKSRAHVEGFSR